MPTTEPNPLVRYLRVQAVSDREVMRVLRQAYEDSRPHLDRIADAGQGDGVRAAQVRAAQAEIKRELDRLAVSVGNITQNNSNKASDAAVDDLYAPIREYLQAAGVSAENVAIMIESTKATARQGLTTVMSRMTTSALPLSEKVYRTADLMDGQIDRIINSGLARGLSARELAAEVRAFIRPDTPGGARYASMRLARTEINNAFHATQANEAEKSPFVTACRWRLSGSHPTPDECNEYAEQGDLGDGLWSPGRVPAKPHPNCLCYLTNEVPSRAAFLKAFQAGEYDDWIAEQGVDVVGANRLIAGARAPGVSGARVSTGGLAAAPRAVNNLPRYGSAELTEALQASQRVEAMARIHYRKAKVSGPADMAKEAYTGNAYKSMNGLLRTPDDMVRNFNPAEIEYAQKANENLAKAFEQGGFAVPEETLVVRGMKKLDTDGMETGSFWADEGWLSTSADKRVSDLFQGRHKDNPDGWTFVTRLQPGVRVVPGSELEAEFILNRGTVHRILEVDPENRIIYTEVSP